MKNDFFYENYKTDKNKIIITPGKFEGEMYYVPHFWQIYLDGGHDEETEDGEIVFKVETYEKDKYPELSDAHYLLLFEDVLGFIYGRWLTRKMYMEEYND
ncbi:uncharacterized protein METZ01_LOCUS410350 [marine metagenome]|uniref:Uncharacterized protein n=1 Tax=marine metagenome TaxID=408172 RepID=A0A382WF13_9ZZZZ|tara:strand:- start:329 stop:628 length:300 start_codon:yes stop_codon:yes gene_type:complete